MFKRRLTLSTALIFALSPNESSSLLLTWAVIQPHRGLSTCRLANLCKCLAPSVLHHRVSQITHNSFDMQIRNSITLIGNVGQNPEVINSKNGDEYLRFSLATNERYTDKNGNKVERTEWHTIMVFGKKVEYLKDNLGKGDLLALSGTLRYNKWVDKHDQKRTSTSIHLQDYTYLSSKNKEQEAEPQMA